MNSFSKTYCSRTPFYEEKETPPFNELILSWNGLRPKRGKWTFWVSLKEGEWLKYAEWSAQGQKTFQSEGLFAATYQDIAFPKKGVCNRFQIKVEGEDLHLFHSLNVCISNLPEYSLILPENLSPILLIPMHRQSQMILDHPRHRDLCSPTSTSTAIAYLLKEKKIDPVHFATLCHDNAFDIFGNWVLNTAESYNQTSIPCAVSRLNSFCELHAHLLQGKPVVVSVKGEIPGAPIPYHSGHLICVIGYEANHIYCIDPAFPDNESTFVKYDKSDFLKAWGKRNNLAYVWNHPY